MTASVSASSGRFSSLLWDLANQRKSSAGRVCRTWESLLVVRSSSFTSRGHSASWSVDPWRSSHTHNFAHPSPAAASNVKV